MNRLTTSLAVALLLCGAACGTDKPDGETPDVGVTTPDDVSGSTPDTSTLQDVSKPSPDATTAPDTGAPDIDEPDVPQGPLDPTEYCETSVEMFCDYYLRCGRIAATDMEDCRTNFLQTCNAGFEPHYVVYAERGELELSREGLAQCATHLETVECDRQVNDLDGGCAGVWLGQVEAGGACGIGIASFVCEQGTTCVVDTTFCGECVAAGDVGEACVDDRCVATARCVEGMCVARGLPGDSCDDDTPCAVGIGCTGGICQPRTYVGVGDACNAAARCPYQTTCRGGVCVQDALLGGDCSAASCGSGWCDGSVCREFIPVGEGCSEGFQCMSMQCVAGTCASPRSSCLP